MKNSTLAIVCAVCLGASNLFAQFRFQTQDAPVVAGPKLGASRSQIWRAGIVIDPKAPLQDVTVLVPIPMDWPEQKVLGVSEEIVPGAKLSYKVHDDGAKEAVFVIDKMRSVRRTTLVVEVELLNYELLPPDNPDDYVIPKRTPRGLERYLKPSPSIECDDRRFAALFKKLTGNKTSDWAKVEAVYRFVQDHVRYDETTRAKKEKGALAVLSEPEGDRTGDCKDMSCLFVAICRAGKIPARIVRVPEHCYAEFYLEIKPGVLPEEPVETGRRGRSVSEPKGFWFPCQVAGSYSFGGIPERQPILQKGDSYPDRSKDNRKAKRLFLVEHFEGNVLDGGPRPQFKWVHEVRGK